MEPLHGVVQHYAWGDHDALPELCGQAPDGRPWAEVWFGTHRGGPATTASGASLLDVAGELPFLVKLLAAAEPLSLQTHPTAVQARRGFAAEEAAGVAIDSPARTYRDRSAKPELLCALTRFEALCAFRPFSETAAWFDKRGWNELAERLGDGPQAYVRWALTARQATLPPDAPTWATRIADRYPGDGGVLVALLLHHVVLAPGEAIYLDAGNLHAYLHGTAVEVMGASDNVVRGGLTPKHVDVDELLRVVRFEALADPVVRPVEVSPGEWRYDTPGAPFRTTRFDIDGRWEHAAAGREIVVCTAGGGVPLRRGDAIFLGPGDRIAQSATATPQSATATPQSATATPQSATATTVFCVAEA